LLSQVLKGFSLLSGLSLPRGPTFASPQKQQKGVAPDCSATCWFSMAKSKELAIAQTAFDF
jgi:hypothetical protein